MKRDPRRLEANAYPFVMRVEPRFADMDILQHINNLALAQYLEDARVRFFEQIFGGNFLFRKRDFRLLVANASYSYLSEAHYPHSLEASVAVARIGNSSFEMALALFQDERCACLSDVVMVHVTTDGPSPMSAEFRSNIATHMLKPRVIAYANVANPEGKLLTIRSL